MKKALFVFVVLLFLAAGVFFGFSKLYLWTENNNFEKLRLKSKLDCQTMPYHCAIRDQKISSIKQLKDKFLDINSRDLWNKTALIYASSNNLPGSEELVNLGADVNLFDENGESALSYALNYKNFQLADFLISHKADVNFKIQRGDKHMTLLTNAITNKNVEIAKYLVSKNASLELKDDYGYNACERVKMYHLHEIMNFINC